MELQEVVNWLCLAILLTTAGLIRAWGLVSRLRQGLERSLAQFGDRVGHLEEVSKALEGDERSRHDGDLVGLLGSLLQYNEALRAPRPRAGGERPSAPPGKGMG